MKRKAFLWSFLSLLIIGIIAGSFYFVRPPPQEPNDTQLLAEIEELHRKREVLLQQRRQLLERLGSARHRRQVLREELN